jgi:biopolymer transport protein TolQ
MNPVEVTQDLSIVSLVLHASLLVQFVMGLLLVMSLFSWTYIFRKAFALRAARSQTESFERDFWAGGDLQALYQSAANNRHTTGALERIFEAGMREYLKARELQRGGGDPSAILDASRRAMRAAYQREMDSLESHLPFLASVGSVSPYIGLFGTVWGIMNAFRGLSNVQQATLSAVAPGIAEALVATAIGLFAAIPAVIAYNRYATEMDRLANRFESFMEEFSNILQRQTREGAKHMATIQRTRRARRAKADINVVPYIDVMLVLLVIFMVAAPVVNPGVVNLPSVANATPQQTQPPIVVTIKGDGTILARVKTGSGATEQKLANNNELRAFVKQRTDENPDQPVVIAADKSVQYDRVLTVMSVLKGDGVKRVGLMVKSS